MNKDKLNKLESVSKHIISRFLFERIKDEDNIFGIVTVTKIIISSDLSYLDVYVSCFQNQESLTKKLAQYAYKMQKELNSSLSIRKIPRIRFKYDESSEVTCELEQKINKHCNS